MLQATITTVVAHLKRLRVGKRGRMARKAKLTKSHMLSDMGEVFLARGYDGASMSQLAAAIGLNKATLYHHFPGGKAEIAGLILARAGARLQRLVLAPLDSGGANGLARSIEGVRAYYEGHLPGCYMNALMMGDGAGLFGADIGAAVGRWRHGLEKYLPDAVSGDSIIARWQGALVLCRINASRAPLEAQCDALLQQYCSL